MHGVRVGWDRGRRGQRWGWTALMASRGRRVGDGGRGAGCRRVGDWRGLIRREFELSEEDEVKLLPWQWR